LDISWPAAPFVPGALSAADDLVPGADAFERVVLVGLVTGTFMAVFLLDGGGGCLRLGSRCLVTRDIDRTDICGGPLLLGAGSVRLVPLEDVGLFMFGK